MTELPVKYAYMLGELTNGGQERQLVYLLEEMVKHGETPALIVWNYRETDKYADALNKLAIPSLRLEVSWSNSRKIKASRAFLKKHKPDFVHSFSFYLNFFCYLAAFGLPVIPIGGFRSRLFYNRKRNPLYKFILCTLFPRIIISNNRAFGQGYYSWYTRWLIGRVYVVQNKLDLSLFPLTDFNENKKHITSFSIGRISDEKRVINMAEIAARLVKEGYHFTHFHAGSGPDMEITARRIRELGIEEHFILYGTVKDINRFINQHDFMIHAAQIEGFPNCIMEAMASARGVVSTDCGDTRFIVKNGYNGFVVPLNDMEQLYEKWKYMMDNPVRIKEFGMNGRSFAEKEFPVERLYRDTLDIYLRNKN